MDCLWVIAYLVVWFDFVVVDLLVGLQLWLLACGWLIGGVRLAVLLWV